MSGTLCEHELEKVSYFLDLWYLSDSSYLAEVLMLLPNPHHLCLIVADAPRWHLFYYVLILVGHSVREYISYHAKILFRRLFQFLISGGKRMSGISFTTRIYCKKTAECTFHNPRAGTLSKLFSSSEALLVFFLYGQTLYTAIIFPDGDEHVYRWTEQFWSEIWKKKSKAWKRHKETKSFRSQCQWPWSHVKSSITVLPFCLWWNRWQNQLPLDDPLVDFFILNIDSGTRFEPWNVFSWQPPWLANVWCCPKYPQRHLVCTERPLKCKKTNSRAMNKSPPRFSVVTLKYGH